MVLLVTSDNEKFQVDKQVAERSILIKNMLEGMSRSLLERVLHISVRFYRRRWIWPANPTTERKLKCDEEGQYLGLATKLRSWRLPT